jgi:hypothetical protein
MRTVIHLATILLPFALAAHPRAQFDAANPTVRLDDGVFVGVNNNTVSEFLGIPYGQTTYVPINFHYQL